MIHPTVPNVRWSEFTLNSWHLTSSDTATTTGGSFNDHGTASVVWHDIVDDVPPTIRKKRRVSRFMLSSAPDDYTISTRARPEPRREFNRYVNASDLMEEFINDMGRLGMSQAQFMGLPVNAFITWLVLKAAQADGEVARWRCKSCGRFTPVGLIACSPGHVTRLLAAKGAP